MLVHAALFLAAVALTEWRRAVVSALCTGATLSASQSLVLFTLVRSFVIQSIAAGLVENSFRAHHRLGC
jgi:hypothetical protein